MLVDEQVMPGVLAEEKPADQGVPVLMEETEQIVKKTEEAVEEKEKQEEKEEDAVFDNVSAEHSMDRTSPHFTAVNAPAQITTKEAASREAANAGSNGATTNAM